ncbi:MAG: radical protein [Thermoleophilia bacterium]|nr:radical protein [Thermoleophilia bacterium]
MPRVEYSEQPARQALFNSSAMPGIDWTLNPYTGCSHRCTFCYVRGFELRAGRPSDDRYGRAVRVKTGIVEQLRRELERGPRRASVAIGTATDPYQPAEGRYRLTRGCIRELGAARTPIHIITRGPLIVRDIDVLTDAARLTTVRVNISLPTIDLDLWRATEPGTAPPKQRLRALRMLVDAGLDVGVGLAPLLPDLSDNVDSVRRVLDAAREAGACRAWMGMLNLRPGVREHFLTELAKDYPQAINLYEKLYAKAYLPKSYERTQLNELHRVKRAADIRDRRTVHIEPELQLSLL